MGGAKDSGKPVNYTLKSAFLPVAKAVQQQQAQALAMSKRRKKTVLPPLPKK